MRVGNEEENLAAIGQAGTGTEAFVVSEVAPCEVDGSAEVGKQLFGEFRTGLMVGGRDQIKTDTDVGADAGRGFMYQTFKDDDTPVVKGCQATDTERTLTLRTISSKGVGDVPILIERLQIVAEALQSQAVGNGAADVGLLTVALQ